MKIKLQLLLLLIGLVLSLSLNSESNVKFNVEEFNAAGTWKPNESQKKQIDEILEALKTEEDEFKFWSKTGVREPAKPTIHLICDSKGTFNDKPIERVVEIRVIDLVGDDNVCLAKTYGFPFIRGRSFGDAYNRNKGSSKCLVTDRFIEVDFLSKYDWADQITITVNRYTGIITASWYNKNTNIDSNIRGKCKDFVKKNTDNSSATLNKTPKKSRSYSSGTGFYANKKGLMITNNHVVKSCNKIKVDGSSAVVKSFDTTNDLALLQVESSPSSVPYFRSGKGIRLGDGVTVAGYPLRRVLGSGLNVVTGTVASLSGVKNNSSRLQITAPINSGNSGGPLFDSSGRVVGVIVSKINNTKARKVLGEEIQGANFAIKGSVVRSFLDMNDVDYEVSSSNKNMSTADIAENAKEYTALIKCWK